ncbi:exodeoxyribonuclease V alpha subunit [Mycoplasma testudineum]|uniref:Exodeoxyribonuclease V alpha subunit n=1 Tax=Mycoplasma testudineum TaxID=244584 RepID=A0A4R6ID77_9MOLU|nr:AAA family ATPase [Mycoplasma testudineum]OYD26728.1 hypothetical protein CG473_02120 [Mycoplasma testudineum]TDO19864.1 exodeoxyribonuclease V alpha subunit [Mycoplasma testudineum]
MKNIVYLIKNSDSNGFWYEILTFENNEKKVIEIVDTDFIFVDNLHYFANIEFDNNDKATIKWMFPYFEKEPKKWIQSIMTNELIASELSESWGWKLIVSKLARAIKNSIDEKKLTSWETELLRLFNFEIFEKYKLKTFFLELLVMIKSLIRPSIVSNYEFLENPYLLFEEYETSISFESIDQFYLQFLKGDKESELRISNLILYETKKVENSNSTLIIPNILKWKVTKNLHIDDLTYENYLNKLLDTDKLRKIGSKLTLSSTYKKERYIYDFLFKLNSVKQKKINFEPSDICSEEQNEAVKKALQNSVSLVTGLPGSGKTFVVKEIVNNLLKKFDSKNIALVTPTGKAASNLMQKTDFESKTIHSYFDLLAKIDEEPINFSYLKVLIIDEFSMVNISVFYDVITKLTNLEKLILVGDINQLPAIGAGNLLTDISEWSIIENTNLTKNYRAILAPDIFETISKVLKNDSEITNFKNVKLVHSNTENLQATIINVYLKNLATVDVLDKDIIIPIKSGDYGVFEINKKIQELIFKNKEPIKKTKYKKFYVGDKVNQTVNNYEDEIFNGQVAILDQDEKDEKLFLKFKHKSVNITKTKTNKWSEIDLAYANTIHKFQGSENDYIIVVISKEYNYLNTMKMIYTAISRAKKKLIIVGDMNYFIYELIPNLKNKKVETNLKLFIWNKYS